jgi:hypothetical protein
MSLARFVVVSNAPRFWTSRVVDQTADLVVMDGLSDEEAAEWAKDANRDHDAGLVVTGRGGPLPIRFWPPRLV